MKTLKKVQDLFRRRKILTAPLLIIRKDGGDAGVREYKSLEDAIADLENDPNVPPEKIEKLKTSIKQFKNKTSITIRNGEII